MKRYVAALLTIGLMAGLLALPAEARKKKKPTVRVLELSYSQPAIGVGGVGGSCPAGACPPIGVSMNETYAVIQVVDDLSPTGYISLSYDSNGDGIEELGNGPDVCGSTPEAVALQPGTSYTAWPWVAGAGCPGASSTSGTIKVFLSSDAKAAEKAAAKG